MQRFRILNLVIHIKPVTIYNNLMPNNLILYPKSYVDSLKHLRRQGDDLHVSFITELTGHRTENTGTARFIRVIQQYYGVVVEADIRTVTATELFLRSYNNSFGYGTFFHTATGDSVFHGHHNLIAYTCIVLAGVAEHADAEHFFRATVICYVQP